MLYRPLKTKVRSFDLALRFSVFPKHNAFDFMLLQIIPQSFKCPRNVQLRYAMPNECVLFQMMWIALEMRANCFVCSITQMSLRIFQGVFKGSYMPMGSWVFIINLYPVRPMPRNRVWLTARNKIGRASCRERV